VLLPAADLSIAIAGLTLQDLFAKAVKGVLLVFGVDIFSKENPLGQLGLIFTLNQMIYLLIVMWVFSAVPEKMIMVYAMVFGAHLFPYSWLYKSKGYTVVAISIPVISLILGCTLNGTTVAAAACIIEVVFACVLHGQHRLCGCSRGSFRPTRLSAFRRFGRRLRQRLICLFLGSQCRCSNGKWLWVSPPG